MVAQLRKMSGSEFAKRKESLLSKLKKPPANIGEISGDEWGQIWNGWLCFDMKAKMASYLENGLKGPESMIALWQKFLQRGNGRSGKRFKKVSVKMFAAGEH